MKKLNTYYLGYVSKVEHTGYVSNYSTYITENQEHNFLIYENNMNKQGIKPKLNRTLQMIFVSFTEIRDIGAVKTYADFKSLINEINLMLGVKRILFAEEVNRISKIISPNYLHCSIFK